MQTWACMPLLQRCFIGCHPALSQCMIQTAEGHAAWQQETREALGVRLDGAVVVVDEAHNLVHSRASYCSVLLLKKQTSSWLQTTCDLQQLCARS